MWIFMIHGSRTNALHSSDSLAEKDKNVTGVWVYGVVHLQKNAKHYVIDLYPFFFIELSE